jgi:DNA repair exonuclease SbcCD ATPase subunit
MQKIIFKNISIQNFLSVGETPLKLNFNKGISLITGLNKDKDSKNGCGKTTILDALYWNIFGNTIRDIKKDKIIHNQSKKNCVVIMEFTREIPSQEIENFKIERCIEPSYVHLYRNEEDITLSSMPKTDEQIKEIIGGNEEVFRNAVIMSLDNSMPFMAQKKIEKRKFVEGILQINIFSDMLQKVRQDFNESKKEYEILVNKFNEQQKSLKIFNEQLEKNKQQKTLKLKQLEDKITVNLQKIEEINKIEDTSVTIEKCKTHIGTIENTIESEESSLIQISEIIEKLSKEETLVESEVERSESEIRKIKSKSGVCPTCKREYATESKEVIEKHLLELNEKLETKQDELKIVVENTNKQKQIKITNQNNIKNSKDILKKLNEKISKLSSLAQEISFLEKTNNDIKLEMTTITFDKDDLEDTIEKIKSEINDSENLLSNFQKKLNILESAKFVVSEEGVKSFIIKKMLDLLNQKLNYYLNLLEAPCVCSFDETFEETLINEHKKECSYFNFSGGERARINLAVLFTFQDILKTQTGIGYSLSVYDELLDSALDEKGVRKVLDILRERTEKHNDSVYIISHNSTIAKNEIEQVVMLEKINGQTKIIH